MLAGWVPKARNREGSDVVQGPGRMRACRTQRQQIERDITMWAVNHPDEPPTIAALQHDGLRIPSCPEGGQYSIDGREVHCSVHR